MKPKYHSALHSERARLDPFEALAADAPTRDQRDLMERPFFSLSNGKQVTARQRGLQSTGSAA